MNVHSFFVVHCTMYILIVIYVLLAYAEISTPSPRQQDNEEDCELNKFKITNLKIIAVLVVKFRNKWLISQLYQSIVNKIK